MHPNEELLRRGYDAFTRGDLAALETVIPQDTVWHFPGRNPLSGAYRDRAELFAMFGRAAELSGGTFRIELLDALASDERVVAICVYRAEAGGASIEAKGTAVYDIRDGQVATAWGCIDDQYAYDEFWTNAARAAESKHHRSLDAPEETRRFPLGRLDLVSFGGATVGRATFEPGWRWSESVKPSVGTDSCQLAHLGYCLSGRMHVRMDDGTAYEIAPGEAIGIAPGHDAWVVGDEPVVLLDFQGAAAYAA